MDAVTIATLFGTVLSSFTALVVIMLRFNSQQTKAITKAMNNIADGGKKQAQATSKLVAETKKGNREAEKRNGHLAEISQQGTDAIIAKMDETSGILAVNTKKVAMNAENVKIDVKSKEK